MSHMTLTSLSRQYRPAPGLTRQALAGEVLEIMANFEQEAKETGLALDWSTFTCTPDVQEYTISTMSREDEMTMQDTTLRFGIVAAKVEDD